MTVPYALWYTIIVDNDTRDKLVVYMKQLELDQAGYRQAARRDTMEYWRGWWKAKVHITREVIATLNSILKEVKG